MLHALAAYADKHLPGSESGFTTQRLRWRIELTRGGRIAGVLPLGDGINGQDLPGCPKMDGMEGGGKAHFLVETAQTTSLHFKANEKPEEVEKARKKHLFFVKLLREASTSVPVLSPLVHALEDTAELQKLRELLQKHSARPTDWLDWSVDGTSLRENDDVRNWWRSWRTSDRARGETTSSRARHATESTMVCLLSGQLVVPLLTHRKIKGLSGIGGLGTGDVLVGFDKAAFGSYGLEQSANAAMSDASAQKYADGLNDLVRQHSRKVGNALVAYWFRDRVTQENDPLAFLEEYESGERDEATALGAARRLLDAIRSGNRADLGDNRYYALTISGASGRVMVRDWMEGRFEDLVANVADWFSDLSIVARDGAGLARDPKFMAVCGALVRDLKDLPSPTSATLWSAAVRGTSIPRPLMAQALARFRADLVDKDPPPFNHARLGLIKAYFNRFSAGGDKAVTTYLNSDHPSPAYHCGRLLALLSDLQSSALGDVGAGVVQRYYAAASQTPGLILGRLISNARNHLGKVDADRAFRYEAQLAGVMSQLRDGAPRILDLEGQGLFALGYYQQLAALRAGKKNSTTTNSQGETK